MAINVYTNVSSINAQRNLNINSASQSTTMKRLSSGLRINSASDDAAGMAIGNGLNAQIKGFTQASRNANDGLSLLGTAEGAMVEQTGILQRMRELAVQSASDTNNSTNRSDLNNEVSQLKSELERIARTTSFNSNNLLDGSFQGKDLQVGANSTSNDRITISLSSSRAKDLGSAFKIAGTQVTANAFGSSDLNIVAGGQTYAVAATVDDGVSKTGGTYSALAKATAINAIAQQTGVTAEATTDVDSGAAQIAGTTALGDLKINGVDIAGVTIDTASDNDLVDAINSVYSQTGVTASLDNANHIILNASDGRNVDVTANAAATAVTSFATATTTNRGTVTLRSTTAFTLSGNNETYGGFTDSQVAAQSASENIQGLDLTSKKNAQLAIKIVDTALNQINSRRSQIGALTNRLNTTINNLSSASENASSSYSRIMDADFATETATMQRNSVLQQAGIAILAQANQAPQQALSLLR